MVNLDNLQAIRFDAGAKGRQPITCQQKAGSVYFNAFSRNSSGIQWLTEMHICEWVQLINFFKGIYMKIWCVEKIKIKGTNKYQQLTGNTNLNYKLDSKTSTHQAMTN